MNRMRLACSFLSAALLMCSGALRAQDGPPPPPDARMRGHGGPGGPGGPGPFADRIELMGFEGLHGTES